MAALQRLTSRTFHRGGFLAGVSEHPERIPVGNQGVVLKRSMLRAADRIAQTRDIPAIVTGEALGRVSSQTLTNLNAIDRASETVVLRPLISWDKPDIIDMARRIDVAELAASIPEFCAAISSNRMRELNYRKWNLMKNT